MLEEILLAGLLLLLASSSSLVGKDRTSAQASPQKYIPSIGKGHHEFDLKQVPIQANLSVNKTHITMIPVSICNSTSPSHNLRCKATCIFAENNSTSARRTSRWAS